MQDMETHSKPGAPWWVWRGHGVQEGQALISRTGELWYSQSKVESVIPDHVWSKANFVSLASVLCCS